MNDVRVRVRRFVSTCRVRDRAHLQGRWMKIAVAYISGFGDFDVDYLSIHQLSTYGTHFLCMIHS